MSVWYNKINLKNLKTKSVTHFPKRRSFILIVGCENNQLEISDTPFSNGNNRIEKAPTCLRVGAAFLLYA